MHERSSRAKYASVRLADWKTTFLKLVPSKEAPVKSIELNLTNSIVAPSILAHFQFCPGMFFEITDPQNPAGVNPSPLSSFKVAVQRTAHPSASSLTKLSP